MALIQNFPKPLAAAFELKGRMMTLSVLRILTPNLDAIAAQLDDKIASAPELFQNFPVLLDFEALAGESQIAFDIARLDRLLRDRSFVPVGIRGAGEILTGIAAGVGIGVIAAGTGPDPGRGKSGPGDAPVRTSNVLITKPVRSGQQIYAKGGDLVVLATVSPGAEVLADGNIHVYGPLRGRALAGVQGQADARIFCRELDAELISIAGHYRISENIQESERARPVQVRLHGGDLIIETL